MTHFHDADGIEHDIDWVDQRRQAAVALFLGSCAMIGVSLRMKDAISIAFAAFFVSLFVMMMVRVWREL
jgi:hypothetical protein